MALVLICLMDQAGRSFGMVQRRISNDVYFRRDGRESSISLAPECVALTFSTYRVRLEALTVEIGKLAFSKSIVGGLEAAHIQKMGYLQATCGNCGGRAL